MTSIKFFPCWRTCLFQNSQFSQFLQIIPTNFNFISNEYKGLRCISNQLHITRTFSSSRYTNSEIKNQNFLDGKVNLEVKFHSKLSDVWWDKKNPLHAFNQVRVPFIRNGILASGWIPTSSDKNRLDGLKILDAGCGGGILSEALARIGADVTGIDLSKELIDAAIDHKKQDPHIQDNLKYIKTSIYDHEYNNVENYNAVIVSEVIEHISNKEKFLKSCVNMLKPGGSLFITTPNKTKLSYILTIKIAEGLKIVPYGTHSFKKFITDQDLKTLLRKLNCAIRSMEGIMYNPLTGKFSIVNFKNIMYAVHAQKVIPKKLQIVE